VRSGRQLSSWLERVGELTAAHREQRADRFAGLARRRRRQCHLEGFSESYAKASAAWYTARERGQRERLVRVAECGAETLQITCVGCGTVHERRSGCRVGLLCVPCRGAIAAEKRSAFRSARAAAIGDAGSRGLFKHNRRGGRWSEKFLTLTAPHFPHHSITERIRIVLDAWRRFLRRMNDFWKAQDTRSAQWFRVFEWTPGNSDHLGHPHLHLWVLSPYLPQEDIELWWRESLADESGGDTVDRVVVHVSEISGNDAEHELIKYLTKDITSSGSKIAPELYAEVYTALDGHRLTQASSGFMGKGKATQRACECGCTFPRRVRKQPKAKESAERKP
jgi:hypothetical protein